MGGFTTPISVIPQKETVALLGSWPPCRLLPPPLRSLRLPLLAPLVGSCWQRWPVALAPTTSACLWPPLVCARLLACSVVGLAAPLAALLAQSVTGLLASPWPSRMPPALCSSAGRLLAALFCFLFLVDSSRANNVLRIQGRTQQGIVPPPPNERCLQAFPSSLPTGNILFAFARSHHA